MVEERSRCVERGSLIEVARGQRCPGNTPVVLPRCDSGHREARASWRCVAHDECGPSAQWNRDGRRRQEAAARAVTVAHISNTDGRVTENEAWCVEANQGPSAGDEARDYPVHEPRNLTGVVLSVDFDERFAPVGYVLEQSTCALLVYLQAVVREPASGAMFGDAPRLTRNHLFLQCQHHSPLLRTAERLDDEECSQGRPVIRCERPRPVLNLVENRRRCALHPAQRSF